MIKYLFLHTVELILDLHAARSVDLNIAARQDHQQPPQLLSSLRSYIILKFFLLTLPLPELSKHRKTCHTPPHGPHNLSTGRGTSPL